MPEGGYVGVSVSPNSHMAQFLDGILLSKAGQEIGQMISQLCCSHTQESSISWQQQVSPNLKINKKPVIHRVPEKSHQERRGAIHRCNVLPQREEILIFFFLIHTRVLEQRDSQHI